MKYKTISVHPIDFKGESPEGEISLAIQEHQKQYHTVSQVWCSHKDRDEKFTVDGVLVKPKGCCKKGTVWVLYE